MSSVSVRMKTAPISSIHLFAGRPNRTPHAVAKYPHELCVRQGIRRRDVHGSVDVVAIDQPPNRRDEVLVVNPRHELPAVTGTAAEAVACQAEERVEHASSVRTQRHRRPKRNLPSSDRSTASSKARSHARATSMLNRQELGAFGSLAAENARVLVVRTVVSMRIDRGGARLQPHAWRRAAVAIACPTTRVDNTRDCRISSRFAAVYRQLTLRPARLITTSQPSISRCQLPRVAPSQATTRHGRTSGRRLKTTTSWPSP